MALVMATVQFRNRPTIDHEVNKQLRWKLAARSQTPVPPNPADRRRRHALENNIYFERAIARFISFSITTNFLPSKCAKFSTMWSGNAL